MATGGTAATWQTPSAGASTLLQTSLLSVAADTTTTSTTFVDLLSITLTTGANKLLIHAAGAISNAGANVNMKLRLLVDGVSIGGIQLRSPAAAIGTGFALVDKVTVTAGSHTVKLQWLTASSTAQCRPVTGNVDGESANLLIEEVTV
jgi:hypothetical protein